MLLYFNAGFVKIYIILQIHHGTLLLQYRFCKDLHFTSKSLLLQHEFRKDIYYTSGDAKLRHIPLFKEKRKHFREGGIGVNETICMLPIFINIDIIRPIPM